MSSIKLKISRHSKKQENMCHTQEKNQSTELTDSDKREDRNSKKALK